MTSSRQKTSSEVELWATGENGCQRHTDTGEKRHKKLSGKTNWFKTERNRDNKREKEGKRHHQGKTRDTQDHKKETTKCSTFNKGRTSSQTEKTRTRP